MSECIWCQRPTEGAFCDECRAKIMGAPLLTREQLDELPFGVIELDREGTILAVNRPELEMARLSHHRLAGRNFFAEVAFCADVQDFHGRFDDFMEGRAPSESFDFTYDFPHGKVDVRLTFIRLSEDLALVVSQRDERPGEQRAA